MARERRRRPRVPARRLDRPRARGRRARARSKTSTGCSARCTACCGRARRSCSRYDHPMALAVGRDDDAPGGLPLGRLEVRRSYFDPRPIDVDARRRARSRCGRARSPTCSPALHRAGYRVDVLLEPEPVRSADPGPAVPTAIIWRARKEGVWSRHDARRSGLPATRGRDSASAGEVPSAPYVSDFDATSRAIQYTVKTCSASTPTPKTTAPGSRSHHSQSAARGGTRRRRATSRSARRCTGSCRRGRRRTSDHATNRRTSPMPARCDQHDEDAGLAGQTLGPHHRNRPDQRMDDPQYLDRRTGGEEQRETADDERGDRPHTEMLPKSPIACAVRPPIPASRASSEGSL